ncbi:protein IQ-DOMAIN 14-like [Impatiens glandulifera]|uniref:protein IQ-DOMAIN 14-like n=1 Tax=Impatiens glandulifera TaxID=253017 RepID=UPI001FB0CE52|nr:protein IQ-DOMAIN 14-like [Impatiens glandulifera]
MVKKGSWFSAIKRVFTSNETEKKGSKEIKNDRSWKLKHGENKSFIPHFFFFFSREPTSIERILEEADEEEKKKLFVQQPHPPPRIVSFRLQYQHHQSATKIQSAYRAYMARRSFKALRGLMRLQRMVKGQNVEKQTINTMKMMQLLVRVQTQIQSLRMVPKEEGKSRLQKKVDRAMDKYPWWWNCLELGRKLPGPQPPPDHGSSMKNNIGIGFDNLFLLTLTPPSCSINSGFTMKRRSIKPRGGNEADDYAFDLHLLKDDNYSLSSCPRPYSVPNYMTSTISAKAKLRNSKLIRDSFLSPGMTTINNHSKKCSSMKVLDQHLLHAMGNTSIDSTISMPAVLFAGRRKPFNRFV